MAELQFTEADWERVERDTIAWWNGELDRPLVYLAVTGPVDRPRPFGYQSNYPLEMPAEAVWDQYAPFLEATRFYGDAFPWRWLNFGPGIMAGFTGARVNSVTNPSETVWFTPPGRQSVVDLDLCYDSQNVWWQRVQELTAALVERYAGLVQVSHTDLGGNLDILASFTTTEQLLFDVVEQPEAVCRQVDRITGCGCAIMMSWTRSSVRPAGEHPPGRRSGHRVRPICCSAIFPICSAPGCSSALSCPTW